MLVFQTDGHLSAYGLGWIVEGSVACAHEEAAVVEAHLVVCRSNLLEGQGFLLDRGTYTLYINNNSVVLPRNQGKLLEALLAGGDNLVTSKQLCRALWDTTEFIDENALQVNLTRLKKTMANLGMKQKVVAVRGLGYRLEREDMA